MIRINFELVITSAITPVGIKLKFFHGFRTSESEFCQMSVLDDDLISCTSFQPFEVELVSCVCI